MNNINKVIKQHHQKVESDKYTFLKPTTYEEVLALIGMMYYRGLYNLCGHSRKILFSEERGLPFFGATMSRDRYQFPLGLTIFLLERHVGNMIALQPLESFLKLLMTTAPNMSHQTIICHLMRPCIPCVVRLDLDNTIQINPLNMGCFSNRLIQRVFHIFIDPLFTLENLKGN